MILQAYFNQNELWDEEKLKQHCEHNLVHFCDSQRFPHLKLLHYKEEAHFDQLWSKFCLHCRGVVVDLKNRKILAHPFNKFFNLEEQPETRYDYLTTLGKFDVSEKLDGSMLILFQDLVTNDFYFTTKGSLDSEHGIYATSIMPQQLKNEKLVSRYTLMFELIDSKFRNVIDYTKKKDYKEGVYLIGARDRITNKLLSFQEIQQLASDLNVSTFKIYQFSTLDEIIENTKSLPVLEEGYVLNFPEKELLVKIKGIEYLRVHRFLSKLSNAYILESLQFGKEQQLIDLAPEEYREDVRKTILNYKVQRNEIVMMSYEIFSRAPKGSRKEFALWVQENTPSALRGFMFVLLDGKEIPDFKVYKLIESKSKLPDEEVFLLYNNTMLGPFKSEEDAKKFKGTETDNKFQRVTKCLLPDKERRNV